MRIGKRVTYALLGSLVTLNLLFRYPTDFSALLGADSTFLHVLANGIIAQGQAPWVISPWSYFGLYAMSYPSGIPFLTAAFSELSGMPVSAGMLAVSDIFALVGILCAYFAAREIKNDGVFPLVISFLFSLAPFFVKETTWVGASRGFVVALVPLAFLLVIRNARTKDPRHLALFGLVFFLAAVLHRMGFLVGFILVAYVFTLPLHKFTQRVRFALARFEKPFRWLALATCVSGFGLVFSVQILAPGISGSDIREEYGSGAFFQGTDGLTVLANMAINFGGKVGLVFPMVLVGLVAYTWRRPKEFQDKFVLLSIFVLVPLLSLRGYITEFVIFPFVLLSGIGAFWIVRRRNLPGKLASVALIGLVVASGTFSWEMRDYWRDRYPTDGQIPPSVETASIYAMNLPDGSFICNEGLIAGQASALSGRAVLPLGGASLHWFSAEQLVFGFQNPAELRVTLLPVQEISFSTDEIFVPVVARNAEQDWETIVYNPVDNARVQSLMTRYDIGYVLLDKSRPDEAHVYTRYQPSPFLRSVATDYYIIFDSENFSVYLVR